MRRAARTLRLLAAAGLTTILLAGLLSGPAAAQEAPDASAAPADPAPTDLDGAAGADPAVPAVPDVSISVDSDDPALSRTVVLILLLTVGSAAPGLLLLMTTFTRFVVVLGLAKNALALQTVPPAQVLVGLALFLTYFVMAPVLGQVNEQAVQPLLAGEIGQSEAIDVGFAPVRAFMLAQTRDSDLRLFMDLARTPRPETVEDVPASTLIPAFVISELRTAFVIGFVVFVPFLVIDLVVAAVLMSMGMVMLPPVFISLPLKLLLFVLVDGWVLIVGSLVGSVKGIG
ncbi:MAG TPA: flagellar type III secretion system pore protein FliP [Egibacteraceae bacterium]|nr:flagellar type III secretion system pore protein FliP [Egibacteraceae bacterium]